MAWVWSRERAAAKVWAQKQTIKAEWEVSWLLNKAEALLAQLDYAVGGAPSGMDRALIGQCQRAIQELSAAQIELRIAMSAISSLGEYEWIPDELLEEEYR